MSRIEAMLSLIVPNVIEEISVNYSVSEIEATKMFYNSKTYELLEREETGVWHYSPKNLYHIFKSEQDTGEPLLPEGI